MKTKIALASLVAVVVGSGCTTVVVKNPQQAKAAPAAVDQVKTSMAAPVENPSNQVKAIVEAVTSKLRFETNQAKIQPEVASELRTAASLLAQMPQVKVKVVGHTDSTGAAKLNQKLSSKRAQAVQQILTQAGVSKNQVMVEAKAASQPVSDNSTPAGRAQNRRAEIAVQ